MSNYFYDTSALLNLQEKAFEEPFALSIVTLYELEQIKTSRNKDEAVKAAARNVTRLLVENPTAYKVFDAWNDISAPEGLNPCDWLIVGAAQRAKHYEFVTDDLCLANIARSKGIKTRRSSDLTSKEERYTGFIEIEPDNGLMETIHKDLTVNTVGALVNQYVFVKGYGKTCFSYRWTGDEYTLIYSHPLDSPEFGMVKAKDMYQRAAVDSIVHNMVTAIAGPAGSGKSLLSLATAFDLIRRGRYDRVVILANPAKAYGAVDMGYYPGTSTEKLMASFLGNMLCTKFGDQYGVETLIDAGKLRVISMGDVRGMEIRENEILYIPECQNTTVDLLKLCLSRVCDGAKVIFEGDYSAQVDSLAFTGYRNGMKKAVEALKGAPLFGYVELQKVWRSELGRYLEKM